MLSEAERRALWNWAKRRRTAQGLALRARIVLVCADGGPNFAVAARLGVSLGTVTKWRAQFLARRLDGLGDEPRPRVPRSISDAQVEEVVVVRTLEEVPEGATHWSKRDLARKVGISRPACTASGGRSACCHGAPRTSRSPPTRCSSLRSATWSACTSRRRRTRRSSRSTRSRRSRLLPGSDSGVRDGRQPALSVSPSVADGLSGGRCEGDSRLQSRSRRDLSSMRLLLFPSRTRT